MAIMRAQLTFPFFTGLPQDVAVNTSYWYDGTGPMNAVGVAEIENRLNAAYDRLSNYISAVVLPRRATLAVYDLNDPAPRQPWDPAAGWGVDLLPASASSGLPNECAVCVSYFGAPLSGTAPSSRRGRMYLGPLSTNALTNGTSTSMPTVSINLMNAAKLFAEDLATPMNEGANLIWVQWSNARQVFAPVIGGWTDSEFDTQRRRGAEATNRVTFTAAQT